MPVLKNACPVGEGTTPTEPREGFWWFSGHRTIRGTQRVCVDEPVCVCWKYHGYEKQLGVIMLGRGQHFRLESFVGTWQPIVCEPLLEVDA
jgi:hypothetical protein